jgi:hypothetical protein
MKSTASIRKAKQSEVQDIKPCPERIARLDLRRGKIYRYRGKSAKLVTNLREEEEETQEEEVTDNRGVSNWVPLPSYRSPAAAVEEYRRLFFPDYDPR